MTRDGCRARIRRWSRLASLPFALAALLVGVGACGTTELHHVVTGSVGPPRSGNVRFLMGDEPVPPELHEVAVLQVLGTGSNANRQRVLEGLEVDARALGCTVVAMIQIDRGVSVASGTAVCLRP